MAIGRVAHPLNSELDLDITYGEYKAKLLISRMAVSLTKIVDGKAAISDTLTNSQTVKCLECEQEFRLGYSDGEWNRVKDWLAIAESAIRKDHKRKHEVASVGLEWRGLRRR